MGTLMEDMGRQSQEVFNAKGAWVEDWVAAKMQMRLAAYVHLTF